MRPTLLIISFCLCTFSKSTAQYVGIGTTNPTFPLTLVRNGIGFSQGAAPNEPQVGFYTGPNSAYLQTHNNFPLYFSTNNSNPQMTLTTLGYLGIGNTNPQAKLEVSGNTILNGNLRITGGNTAPGTGKVLMSDGSGNASWQMPATQAKVGFSVAGVVGNGVNVLSSNWNKVHFAVERHDPGNDYNISSQTPSSTFIVPKNGFYHLSTFINWDVILNSEFQYTGIKIMYSRGGVVNTLAYRGQKMIDEKFGSLYLSLDVTLIQGDQIWVEVYHQSTNSINSILKTDTYAAGFSGYLIWE